MACLCGQMLFFFKLVLRRFRNFGAYSRRHGLAYFVHAFNEIDNHNEPLCDDQSSRISIIYENMFKILPTKRPIPDQLVGQSFHRPLLGLQRYPLPSRRPCPRLHRPAPATRQTQRFRPRPL